MAATPTNAFERTLGKLTPNALADALPLLESVLIDMMIEQGTDLKLSNEDKAAGARVLSGAVQVVRRKVLQHMQPQRAPEPKVVLEIPPRPPRSTPTANQ